MKNCGSGSVYSDGWVTGSNCGKIYNFKGKSQHLEYLLAKALIDMESINWEQPLHP